MALNLSKITSVNLNAKKLPYLLNLIFEKSLSLLIPTLSSPENFNPNASLTPLLSFPNPETHFELKPPKHGKWRRPFFDSSVSISRFT
jgi:hypothetical protein